MSQKGRVEIDILRPVVCELPELVSERGYEQQMTAVIEPWLRRIRQNGRFGKRSELYYELYPVSPGKGTVVLCHGYMESCEKYHEFIYYLVQCGFQVAAYDLRGHGKSTRENPERDIVHIQSFDDYVKDLDRFVREIVMVEMNADKKSLYLFGHSLGGCIAARYIEEYPGMFAKVILNAPLLGINFGSLPEPAALLGSMFMTRIGQGMHRCIGQKAFDQRPNPSISGGRSEARYLYYHKIRVQTREYQVSGSDYFWVREVIRAGHQARFFLEMEKIRSDILVIMAGQDDVADRKAQEEFVSRLKYGRAVLVPQSRHETYNEPNDVLKDYLSLIISWLDPRGKE